MHASREIPMSNASRRKANQDERPLSMRRTFASIHAYAANEVGSALIRLSPGFIDAVRTVSRPHRGSRALYVVAFAVVLFGAGLFGDKSTRVFLLDRGRASYAELGARDALPPAEVIPVSVDSPTPAKATIDQPANAKPAEDPAARKADAPPAVVSGEATSRAPRLKRPTREKRSHKPRR